MRKFSIIAAVVITAFIVFSIFFWKSSHELDVNSHENSETSDSNNITEPNTSTVADAQLNIKEAEPTPEISVELLFEAEDAALVELDKFSINDNDTFALASGDGYVGSWSLKKSRLSFEVDISVSGKYELVFVTAAIANESYNTITVNNRLFYNALYTEGDVFSPSSIKAELNEGKNIISVEYSWGGIYMDCLYIRSSEGISRDIYNVDKSPVNENASESTLRLMSYLADIYGDYTLSGQYQYDYGINSPEFMELYKLTGRYPAIMGFDFMDYSPSRVEFGAESKQTEYALEWNEMGGIAIFIWHWNAPKDLLNTKEQPWYEGCYTEATTFNLEKALNVEDPEGYDLILRDIDAIAEQMKILAENDIPILWRPIHEASGGWFWWGAYGPENYKKLWILMYERLTDFHGLNNLIWVYNGQDADWYPGDEYVDIIGEDFYTVPHDYESSYNLFDKASGYSEENKMIALTENGAIPDPDLMYEDNSCWLFFVTWNDIFVVDKENKEITDEYNTFEHFIGVYNHSKIITLDELPNLASYPID